MGQGNTPTQLANTVYTQASPGTIHMNDAGSQFFVGASVAALCPYYLPQPAQQPTQPQPAHPSLAEKPKCGNCSPVFAHNVNRKSTERAVI